jgi:hypothetical protein
MELIYNIPVIGVKTMKKVRIKLSGEITISVEDMRYPDDDSSSIQTVEIDASDIANARVVSTNQSMSIEHFPGVTDFHELKPGAKVMLYRTDLFNKSAAKLSFNSDRYRTQYINDIKTNLISTISNAKIHEVAISVGHGVRKCYIKINELGARNGGRLYYKAYAADRGKNIAHVYLLYTFYKKDVDEVNEKEKGEIVAEVLKIDKNYLGV